MGEGGFFATVLFILVWAYVAAPYWWQSSRASDAGKKCGSGPLVKSLLFCAMVAWPLVVQAQVGGDTAPHQSMPEGGTISGTLAVRPATEAASHLLSSHPYTIEVMQGSAAVVAVEKTTDAQGRFQIRNVIANPALHYFLRVTHDGRRYRSAALQLPGGVKEATRDLVLTPVGDASAGDVPGVAAPMAMPSSPDRAAAPQIAPFAPTAGEAMPPSAPRDMEHDAASRAWGSDQWISVLLCGGVALLIAWQLMARRGRKV
ncbi:MAG: hypothetical protein HYV02_08000 [Deltaproteobacteria bacterium]|nr:hypothetical protein [Deltaproteobacteria bacterium]